MARELAGVHGDINDVLTNVKKVSEDFSKKKNETIELNELMQDDHSKFLKIMGVRAKAIQTILEYWSKGNVRQVMQNLKKYHFVIW